MPRRWSRPNSFEMSRINQIKILDLVRDNDGMSRADLARATGLSRPAVSSVVESLIDKYRLVVEVGLGDSTTSGGRRPRCLSFNGGEHYIIGLDVGTTNIHGVLANLYADVISEKVIPTQYESGFENVMSRCGDVIEYLITEAPVTEDDVLGIGVAVGGLVNRNTGIVEVAPKFGWEDVDVIGELSNRTSVPIVCDYVVRVMTLGEKWYGRGADFDDFICVSLSHGIGAGVIIDGNLFYGSQGMCGELGHVVVDKDSDVVCKCGNKGCLSALASGFGIAMAARRAIDAGETGDILIKLCNGNVSAITAETVADAARQGDELSMRIFRNAAEYIGLAMSTLINLFNPRAIFFGGGVAQAEDLLLDVVRDTVAAHAIPRLARDVKILPVTHGMDAPTMGAIALILREVLRLNICVKPPKQQRVTRW